MKNENDTNYRENSLAGLARLRTAACEQLNTRSLAGISDVRPQGEETQAAVVDQSQSTPQQDTSKKQ